MMSERAAEMSVELAEKCGRKLRQSGKTLAVAESCSGGLIGHLITEVPGSSDYFIGGVISYSNQVKADQLGVEQAILEQHGAVSVQTAEAMAAGIRRLLGTDFGLSVTGIAGPSGGTDQKPVGLTWIGLSAEDGRVAERYLFEGDRSQVKQQAAEAALKLLLTYLQMGDDDTN